MYMNRRKIVRHARTPPKICADTSRRSRTRGNATGAPNIKSFFIFFFFCPFRFFSPPFRSLVGCKRAAVFRAQDLHRRRRRRTGKSRRNLSTRGPPPTAPPLATGILRYRSTARAAPSPVYTRYTVYTTHIHKLNRRVQPLRAHHLLYYTTASPRTVTAYFNYCAN